MSTWHKLVGILRVVYRPGGWVYDASIKQNRYVPPLFYSYMDYGITSQWYKNN